MSRLLLLPCALFALALTASAQDCGTERWTIKTLSDADTSIVRFDTVIVSSVTEQTRLARQVIGMSDPRYSTETTVYRITGLLTDFKRETDQDLHLVIRDPLTDSSMVIEIPSDTCPSARVTSRAPLYEAARQWIRTNAGNPTTAFKTLTPGKLVTITGVGYWDFPHGQRGMAANCREIHPVLSIEDGPSAVSGEQVATSADLTVAPNPATGSITIALGAAFKDRRVDVRLLDVAAREVYRERMVEGGTALVTFNTADLRTGIYFVLASSGMVTRVRSVVVSR